MAETDAMLISSKAELTILNCNQSRAVFYVLKDRALLSDARSDKKYNWKWKSK